MSGENGGFGLIAVVVVVFVFIVVVVCGSLALEPLVVRCLLDVMLAWVDLKTKMVVVVMRSGNANV